MTEFAEMSTRLKIAKFQREGFEYLFEELKIRIRTSADYATLKTIESGAKILAATFPKDNDEFVRKSLKLKLGKMRTALARFLKEQKRTSYTNSSIFIAAEILAKNSSTKEGGEDFIIRNFARQNEMIIQILEDESLQIKKSTIAQLDKIWEKTIW